MRLLYMFLLSSLLVACESGQNLNRGYVISHSQVEKEPSTPKEEED